MHAESINHHKII